MNELLPIGFGNSVNKASVVALVSPDSAPVKRMIQRGKEEGSVIDATQGRKTRSVICTVNDKIILSALTRETLSQRF